MADAGGALAVRVAAPGDLDAVTAIERAAFADPWSRGAFTEALLGSHVRFRVALDAAGAVAGYVISWIVADDAEIANLAVSPAARRSGIATRLLRETLDEAHAAGVRCVHLEVRESNVAARALYTRFGFTVERRRREYYRQPVEDALVLRLDLIAPPS